MYTVRCTVQFTVYTVQYVIMDVEITDKTGLSKCHA